VKAQIRIEAIGDNVYQEIRLWTGVLNTGMPGLAQAVFGNITNSYWVAEITGPDPRYRYARSFVKGKKDYARANSKGSRGIFSYYLLETDRLYEVKAPVTWRRVEHYFCMVTDEGEVQRVDQEFVEQWINDHSALLHTPPPNSG